MATVVLGVTGCIGAYKAAEVLRELQKRNVDVRVVMTENATRFISPMTMEALSRHPVFLDEQALGPESDIQHVALADAADLLLVAPATANILGKFAHGIADDALSTLFLATKARVLVAPAMNVHMFEHPAVLENIRILKERGVSFVEPGTGYLACGWLGKGRLAEVAEIVEAALLSLGRTSSMEGRKVLVTAGPTVEDIDPVRFLSNRSSGRMGYRLAEAARDRGAEVTLVAGPTALPDPPGVQVVRVRSASEMALAVQKRVSSSDLLVMAAAVSDYAPEAASLQKLKKGEGRLELTLVATTDILSSIASVKGSCLVVGFAAETENVRENAKKKLLAKSLDLVVANDVSRKDAGFQGETNAALLIDAHSEVDTGLLTKRALAERILDRVAELSAQKTSPRGSAS